MAICLSLEGCKGAWARAREELLRVGAQDGGTVDHADKTSLNRSKVPSAEESLSLGWRCCCICLKILDTPGVGRPTLSCVHMLHEQCVTEIPLSRSRWLSVGMSGTCLRSRRPESATEDNVTTAATSCSVTSIANDRTPVAVHAFLVALGFKLPSLAKVFVLPEMFEATMDSRRAS